MFFFKKKVNLFSKKKVDNKDKYKDEMLENLVKENGFETIENSNPGHLLEYKNCLEYLVDDSLAKYFTGTSKRTPEATLKTRQVINQNIEYILNYYCNQYSEVFKLKEITSFINKTLKREYIDVLLLRNLLIDFKKAI